MISNRLLIYFIITLFSLVSFHDVLSQVTNEFELYSKKYPDNSVIIISKREDMVIEMKHGKPVYSFNEYKEYLALNENANYYSNSKEYFGGTYKLKKIEAYSLVPENDNFKKIPVTYFNNTSETLGSSFYDDVNACNYTFPSVVKGAKMISKRQMVSDGTFFPYKFYFGDFLPCEEFVFTITCPENVDINYRIFGRDTSIVKFSFTRKAGNKIYSWQASNRKSYSKDQYSPEIYYFIPHLIVQISKYVYKGKSLNVINSLEDQYKWNYDKISKINITESPEVKSLADSITTGQTSKRERVRKIYRWVQKNIKYIAFEDGENGYIPHDAELVLKRKYGDCKDKTSLLVAMLRSQGIRASYSWVGTRRIPYKYTEFASGYISNHMIAIWWDDNNKPVLLDGTTRYHTLDDIPTFIQGKECLIEKGPDNYEIYSIPVVSPEKNTIYDSLIVELRGDTLEGTGFSVFNGEMRADMFGYFEGKNNTDLQKIINSYIPKASNKFIIESVNLLSMVETEAQLKYEYNFYLFDYLIINKNNAYINLNLDRFPSDINLKEDRWLPLEMDYTKKHIFVCRLIIPNGYEVRAIPKDSSYENPLFKYQQNYKLSENEIVIKTIVDLNFQILEEKELTQFRDMLSLLNSNYIKSIPLYKTVAQ